MDYFLSDSGEGEQEVEITRWCNIQSVLYQVFHTKHL